MCRVATRARIPSLRHRPVNGGSPQVSSPAAGRVSVAPPHPRLPVTIKTYAFTAFTASPGQTITLRDQDSEPHTVTADDSSFDSGTFDNTTPATLTVPTTLRRRSRQARSRLGRRSHHQPPRRGPDATNSGCLPSRRRLVNDHHHDHDVEKRRTTTVGGVGRRMVELGFARSSGVLGRVGGRLMARANASTERHLVEIAELGPDAAVLVLGPGPGIGLQEAGIRLGSWSVSTPRR